MTARVDAPNRTTTIKRWEPQQRVFHVEAGAATEARVQTFFYPHWKATAGGRNLTVHPDHDGTLVVVLPSEATDVNLEFREPNRSRYASGLSLLGWGLIGGLSLRRKRSSSK
jgi:hypothetical protein